jgi:GNAT superfamily N-acetyltransferase
MALLELWIDLIEHHRRLDPAYPGLPGIREVLLREIERGIERPGCRIWIADADADGGPSGFLFAELDSGGHGSSGRADDGREDGESAAGWIHELYVREPSRRRGVASALVDAAEAWLIERGAPRIRVRVEPANASGLGFWDARDFEERSRILERRAPRA